MSGPGGLVPPGALSPESSIELPTLTIHLVGQPTEVATTYDITTPPTPTLTAEVCTACDNGMPAIAPTTPSHTHAMSTSHAQATPAQATLGGIIAAQPTYGDTIWYHQPWTVPAAGLLGMYALFSFITLALLMFHGLLDMKLNWVPRSRRAGRDRLDLWRVDSVDERAEQTEPVRSRRARGGQQVQPSNASVVETEINYDEELDSGPANQLQWHHAVEMQPHRRATVAYDSYNDGLEACPRPRSHFDERAETRLRDQEMESVMEYESESIRRMRQMLGNDRYEIQVQAWRLHELEMIQNRMTRAGYF